MFTDIYYTILFMNYIIHTIWSGLNSNIAENQEMYAEAKPYKIIERFGAEQVKSFTEAMNLAIDE